MDWLTNLFTATDTVPHIVLLYALVIAAGVYLGKIKIGGISLGVTFVLFAGIFAGSIGLTATQSTLNFVQDFGLILFVFMIGLQVGPGFFESLRKGGLELNALTVVCIVLNIGVMFACYYLFFDTSDSTNLPMLIGTLCGAVTNTPALGAANEALSAAFPNGAPQIASGYACAYPLGVVGLIIASIAVRYCLKVNLKDEEEQLDREAAEHAEAKPQFQYVKVENKYLEGKTLSQIREFLNRDFVCSRMLHDDHVSTPKGTTEVHLGDILFIVCTESDAEAVRAFIGPCVDVEWDKHDDDGIMTSKWVVITNPKINGKKLGAMHFSRFYGANVTRVIRQGIDMFASPNLALQVGDRVVVVGPETAVERVAEKLGNSEQRLNAPNIATIFVGIIVGIIFGTLPIAIPNMPVPMKLGIAGGPLIIALLIGRFGYKVKLVTYTTPSANLMLREIGLVLFLASVGIKAGAAGFIDTMLQGDGVKYVGCGFLITLIPAFIVGMIARIKYHINYFTVIGFLAGAYTGAPALAYANNICTKEAPAVGYSTVYPLSMFLRIFTTQVIVLLCCG